MKTSVILSILFCNLVLANAGSLFDKRSASSSSEEKDIREIAKAMQEKFNITILFDFIAMGDKVKEKCPNLEDKVESAMDRVGECLEDVEIGSETFCSLIKKNAGKCSRPIRDLIVPCMPEESKEFPVMIEKIAMAIIDQACQSTVEEMLELLNPCQFNKNPETVPACVEIKTIIDEHKNKLPSKSLVCQTIPKLRNCGKALLESSCPNPVTKQAHVKMVDAIDKAIKEECNAVNKVR